MLASGNILMVFNNNAGASACGPSGTMSSEHPLPAASTLFNLLNIL
jgi:hypothetical protein